MKQKTFVFDKTVYLTDTNLFGNVYFARYFDWQGMAREAFFHAVMGTEQDELIRAGIKFVTVEASIKYHHEVTLFDQVQITVKPDNVRLTTFDLLFTYRNVKTDELVAEGRQRIGFVDKSNKVILIPKQLQDGWRRFNS